MKILIVDDSLSLRFILREMLKSHGYIADEAADGKQAIEQVKENVYDIIFMDIEMPEMNGIDAANFIRNDLGITKEQTFLVALTAYDEILFQEKFKSHCFDIFLTKPYTNDRLKEIVKSVVDNF